MISDGKYFVEVDCLQICEHGQRVSGGVCLTRRHNDRIILVMADGGGSGVRYKVRAEVVASMALNYTLSEESPLRAAETVMRTFGGDNEGYGRRATFTIIDIHRDGRVRIVEFGDTPYLLFGGGRYEGLRRKARRIEVDGRTFDLHVSDLTASEQDRIVLPTEGVAMSGRLTRRLPEGWGSLGVAEFCSVLIEGNARISAHDLCREVLGQAERNDLLAPKHDLACGAVYFRQPRRIMVFSGPPFNQRKDKILADMVDRYEGTKLICGGTTAKIVSRELGRDLTVDLRRDPAGLPPTSTMEGVDMVTEGVLTLSKVKSLLENFSGHEVAEKGTDGAVARMLLEHDIIEFVVGTRINPIHQDPDLPVELELRRNLIKALGEVLRSRFMKEVRIQYM